MLIFMNTYLWTSVWDVNLARYDLLDKDIWSIYGSVLTHIKPLLYYKLKRETRYPFVLDYPVVSK